MLKLDFSEVALSLLSAARKQAGSRLKNGVVLFQASLADLLIKEDGHGEACSSGDAEGARSGNKNQRRRRRRTMQIGRGDTLFQMAKTWKAKKEEGKVTTSLRVTLFLAILQLLQDKLQSLITRKEQLKAAEKHEWLVIAATPETRRSRRAERMHWSTGRF